MCSSSQDACLLMVIHGPGREGGVLPVIGSQRGRRGGGPEVTGVFTRDKERERAIDRQEERWSEDMRCAEHRDQRSSSAYKGWGWPGVKLLTMNNRLKKHINSQFSLIVSLCLSAGPNICLWVCMAEIEKRCYAEHMMPGGLDEQWKSKPGSGTEPLPAGGNDWSIHVGDTLIMKLSFVAVRGD